ncbi:hypothetical protein PAI11_33070 [Patulibacter medicamentivorans]|uniref:Uncharacterized protein n=1 Tax=Patulibacter medicamentivorans TaxID=1097667 RepID=H0E8Z3_9ACTN|nr:hypothetical protein [Patulibacter medicamentivorans]EHN09846.1 hypothetical protein PAI11_33070 [Patulibacter medicamentivorans]
MAQSTFDIETLLREALSPVDPPERLGVRVENTLRNLSELAADELESWELTAMKDPRNWVRPAAAVAVGGVAGTGLAVLRWRQASKQRNRKRAVALDKAAEEAADLLRRGVERLGNR